MTDKSATSKKSLLVQKKDKECQWRKLQRMRLKRKWEIFIIHPMTYIVLFVVSMAGLCFGSLYEWNFIEMIKGAGGYFVTVIITLLITRLLRTFR